MRTIELVGHVDEQHQLHVEVPAELPAGPVKIRIEMPEEDGRDWERAIAFIWAEDWNDPREDIYTLDDGVSYDGPR